MIHGLLFAALVSFVAGQIDEQVPEQAFETLDPAAAGLSSPEDLTPQSKSIGYSPVLRPGLPFYGAGYAAGPIYGAGYAAAPIYGAAYAAAPIYGAGYPHLYAGHGYGAVGYRPVPYGGYHSYDSYRGYGAGGYRGYGAGGYRGYGASGYGGYPAGGHGGYSHNSHGGHSGPRPIPTSSNSNNAN